MNKYKVGSNLLHLENCKDIDYIILTNEYGNYARRYVDGEDLIYMTQEFLNSLLTYQRKNKRLLIHNYQYDKDIIGQDFPIEYHLLDYRKELINYLKDIVKNKMFNFNKRIRVNKLYCSKCIYHIAYNIFILQNNSPIITEKQKAIVQKIHDGLMPIDYIDVLTSMIDKL